MALSCAVHYPVQAVLLFTASQPLLTSNRENHTSNPHEKIAAVVSGHILATASKFSTTVIPRLSCAQFGSHPTITVGDASIALRKEPTTRVALDIGSSRPSCR
jgi:hypothetical protein